MKKIFTLIVMCVMAVAVNAQITIYVQAAEAPHLWAWNAGGNIFSEDWPGPQMTEKKTVQGVEFWTYTFDATVATPISILFNNGSGGQTKDIEGITSDRYFTYDGNSTFTDVTEDYGGVIPDATITSLQLAGNHTTPVWSEGAQSFTPVVDGTSYTITVDLSDVTVENNIWLFKLIANGGTWFGYSNVTLDAPSYVVQSTLDSKDNFELDLEATPERKFTFTATWGGGKQAGENWSLKIETVSTDIAPVVAVPAENAPRYDLSGRRVDNNFHGVVIQNGKKVLVK